MILEPDVFATVDAAYRATSYIAHLRSDNLTLRVDQPSSALEQLLEINGCTQWAFISAVNPGSQKLNEAVNAGRHRQLLGVVSKLKLVYFAGDGVPDAPGWPIEPGLLVLGISLEQAQSIAVQFGQYAILTGGRGGAPSLHYCTK